MDLPILYEDKDALVIDKPAGIATHPAPGVKEKTLIEEIVEVRPEIARVGDDPTRPGLVQRLDKGVSGVMIIAKTPAAFEHLKTQFKERRVQKTYLALAYGRLPRDTGTIDFPIARSKEGPMTARPKGSEGREAVTDYEVLRRFKTATYVRVTPKTGRTHQIRVHFRALGSPLVGDTLYGMKKMRNIRPIPLDRIFLHAESLSITLPSGERKTFSSPLPPSLSSLLETLPTK